MKPEITFEEFLEIEKKLEIRIGTIISVDRVPKSKLLKLFVSFDGETKSVLTNIGERIENPEETLKGLNFPFITNLAPVTMKGIVSEAMIMISEDKEGKIELKPISGSKLL